jgi:hypothetical protein
VSAIAVDGAFLLEVVDEHRQERWLSRRCAGPRRSHTRCRPSSSPKRDDIIAWALDIASSELGLRSCSGGT